MQNSYNIKWRTVLGIKETATDHDMPIALIIINATARLRDLIINNSIRNRNFENSSKYPHDIYEEKLIV